MSKKVTAAVILWWLGVVNYVGIGIWTFCGHEHEPATAGFMVWTANAVFAPWIIAGIILRWDKNA